MAKRNNKNNPNSLKDVFQNDDFKITFAWLLIIFSITLIVSFIFPSGIFTSKINSFFKNFLGWSRYFLGLFILLASFFLFKKITWLKFLKISFALFLVLLFLTFHFHFIFRQGGKIGYFLLNLGSYFSQPGLVTISFFVLLFSFWLIFENKFLDFLRSLFQSSKEKLEEVKQNFSTTISKEEIKEPIRVIKKEVISQDQIKEKTKEPIKKILIKSSWKLPPIELLSFGKEEVLAPDIKSTSELIRKTLENFGIKVDVVDVEIGPAITRFALKPGEGVKISKILSYQSDLALALGTPNIIIETPIPGKAVFGLQIPNKKAAVVRLGNLLREKTFLHGTLFTIPLGRKINGEPFFVDLAKMPHLLIAGSTGSGKSIFIHDLLISLLMKNSPETLNLILIDPKRVELVHYSDLPHLIMDPVFEIKKTIAVFNWLIEEMEERYKILQETKSRDIDSYNQKQINQKNKPMPRIVLVIDELADLMVTYGNNVESAIIRLTQMARATGIHLVLATQRPSVDIVTGLIKANIPNRLCFKVASYVDSRTVLDTSGAEKLTGEGDGLFMSTSSPRPIRIKAPFVTEKEIEKIANFWKEQAEKMPDFERQTINLEEMEKKTIILEEGIDDEELFRQAVEIVLETKKASTSLLQRKLKIGYARAARLLDLMEEKGIVGPQEGSKPRRVLISKEEFLNGENGPKNQDF
jgi:S-DNA-T family DNA segregation ATPase FtsK/SpoIIIE